MYKLRKFILFLISMLYGEVDRSVYMALQNYSPETYTTCAASYLTLRCSLLK